MSKKGLRLGRGWGRRIGVAGASLAAAVAIVAGSVAGASAAPTARDGLIALMRPGQIGEYDIWVVRPDGTGLRRLTTSPQGHSDYNPTWSPDGSIVLFERRGGSRGEDLYTVMATGGLPRQLTDCSGECWNDGEARFSPDAAKVAFSRATGPTSAFLPTSVAIYTADRDGRSVRQLSKPPRGFEDHYPSWSPDGKTVLFHRSKTGLPGPTTLVAVDVRRPKERVVHAIPRWAPGSGLASFSPSGKRILFGYWCLDGDSCPAATRALKNSRLATIRPDGTDLKIIPIRLRADSGAWSPSGKQIVFRCHTASLTGPFKLCTSRSNGKGLKQFPWPLGSAHPSWGTHP